MSNGELSGFIGRWLPQIEAEMNSVLGHNDDLVPSFHPVPMELREALSVPNGFIYLDLSIQSRTTVLSEELYLDRHLLP